MSVVIVGGHDKMSKEYIKVCKNTESISCRLALTNGRRRSR